ncbi:MAG: BMP family ABC transporter substrate-binding protein [Mycoplasmoidaceae bacterium]
MKFKSFLSAHKVLIKDVVTSTCLLGGSAGIVFGVSAATFKVEYMNLNSAEARYASWKSIGYEDERIDSAWNMTDLDMPEQEMKTISDWSSWHTGAEHAPFEKGSQLELGKEEGEPLSPGVSDKRKEFSSIIIDGATHSIMDRSFNQSLFEGLADFVYNQKLGNYNIDQAHAYKPPQDSTTDFINTYVSIAKKHSVIGLAGFNHATPLTTMMTRRGGNPQATCADDKTNKIMQETAIVLQDANIPDNQCIASVLFRADQPGFLTGLATCEYLIHNPQLYHDHFQDFTVAEYGGVPIPSVTVYMGGFQRGVELFNYGVIQNVFEIGARYAFGDPEIEEERFPNAGKCLQTFNKLIESSKYRSQVKEILNDPSATIADKERRYFEEEKLDKKLYNEFSVKMIKLGDANNHFSGTFTAGDAIGITKQYLNRGASAIICVAGPQSLDTAQEIQNQNSKAIVIGVDSAMENGDYQRWHEYCGASTNKDEKCGDPYWDQSTDSYGHHSNQSHAIIKFSAVKDLKKVTNKINRLIGKGLNWDVSATDESGKKIPDPKRSICGTGFQTCGNIMNGLISISWDGFVPLLEALEHFIYYYRDSSGVLQRKSLVDAWKNAVKIYAEDLGDDWDDVEQTYKDHVEELAVIKRYDRYDAQGDETTYSKNYSHTIGILGRLLSTSKIRFDRNMTLKPIDEEHLEKGFTMLGQHEEVEYSILKWLDYNMYMTC